MFVTCPHCNQRISLALFARHIGRLGGTKTSPAKQRSSRRNGKLGGRPPKQKGRKR